MSPFLQFLKAALREPLQVSTLFQTAPATVRCLTQPLIKSPAASVLELGIGAGAVTSKIHQLMDEPKNYLGFEINPDLHKYMSERFPDFHFVRDSAEHILNHSQGKKFDLVISTLPWSLIPEEIVENILNAVVKVLSEQGEFRTYLTAHVLWAPSSKKFIEKLEKRFQIDHEWVMLNAPPAYVLKMKLKKL